MDAGWPDTGGMMQRTFLSKLRFLIPSFRTFICLFPTLLAAWVVARAYMKDPEHLSGSSSAIDLKGGTILVYEVDQDASKLQARSSDGGHVKADAALAGALKRRIDPGGLDGHRHPADRREPRRNILPYGSQADGGVSQGEVEKIKDLIKEVGSLEFRILANADDDASAISRRASDICNARRSPDSDEAKALR